MNERIVYVKDLSMIIPVVLLISVLKKYLSHQINMKVFAALLLLAFASCGFAEDQTCYQKGANDCSGACAWNFMSLCCSDKNAPLGPSSAKLRCAAIGDVVHTRDRHQTYLPGRQQEPDGHQDRVGDLSCSPRRSS